MPVKRRDDYRVQVSNRVQVSPQRVQVSRIVFTPSGAARTVTEHSSGTSAPDVMTHSYSSSSQVTAGASVTSAHLHFDGAGSSLSSSASSLTGTIKLLLEHVGKAKQLQ